MKINKNSFTYKLVGMWYPSYNMPRTLCALVFALMVSFIATVLVVAFGVITIFILGAVLFVTPVQSWLGTLEDTAILVLSFFLWLAVGILSLAIYRQSDHYKKSTDLLAPFKIATEKNSETKPSIIREYLKARKEKWCPTVEYVD